MKNQYIQPVPADLSLVEQVLDYYKRNKPFLEAFEPKRSEEFFHFEANVMPRNKASLKVLEKNHFVNEGLSKYYLKINGVWEDHIHMVKINYAMH